MLEFKCKDCGNPIKITGSKKLYKCPKCHSLNEKPPKLADK